MRRDKNAPALYELIRDKAAVRSPMRPMPVPGPAAPASSPPRMPPAPRPVQEDDRPPSIFSPGRSIRLPVGYLMFAALFFAVVVVGAYVVGYNRRDNEERQRDSRESATALDAVDPLAVQPPAGRSNVITPQQITKPPQTRQASPGPTDRRATEPTAQNQPQPQATSRQPVPTQSPADSRQQSTPNPTAPQTNTAGQPPAGNAAKPAAQPQNQPKTPEKQPEVAPDTKPKGVVIVTGQRDDPRQVGLNYLIAATLLQEEAEAAAQFLVSRGLEVAVVRADNRGPNRWVVILEGLAAKDLGSQRARTLEQRLQDLGRIYRNELKGPTVFNDPWWKKHTVGTTTPTEEE